MQPLSERTTPAIVDADDLQSILNPLSEPTQREGLPKGFRMRADAHYVEQLDSSPPGTIRLLSQETIDDAEPPGERPSAAFIESIRRHGVLQPLLVQECGRDRRFRLIAGHQRLAAARAAGLKQVPCIVHPLDNAQAAALAAATEVPSTSNPPASAAGADDVHAVAAGKAVHDALMSIVSSSGLLTNPPAVLRGLMSQIIAAEARRALTLLTAMRVLRDELPFSRSPVRASAVVDRVAEEAEEDGRLANPQGNIRTRAQADVVVHGNEELLVAAVNGVLAALTLSLEPGDAADVEITAAQETESPYMTFVVRRNGVAVPQWWVASAFEQSWPVPHGPTALVLMRAAKRIAELHGGSATATADDTGAAVMIRVRAGRNI